MNYEDQLQYENDDYEYYRWLTSVNPFFVVDAEYQIKGMEIL
jgi:hypothetical protein